ncbi:CHAT domain-containing protein [Pleurocapsa sp. PCC 7319]|uniref:CHAT domain-containing protein n=1 Tax=Pleurocapsa sp. PCC 7319 TaxID=118161 RepID=UPI00034D659B|nr:CHAT domain-containing protein [Pleurocapsa sp. PCC 7319]
MKRLGRLIAIAILSLILSLSLNGWFSVNARQPINQNNSELQTPNSKLRTPNSKLRTPNSKLRTPNSELQTPNSLVQAGKQYYHAGKFADAAKALQQATQIYVANQDVIKQAQTLSFLSLAYQELGQLQQAEKAINSSLSLLENLTSGEPHNQVHAQVLNRQGRLLLARGKTEQALATFQTTELLYKQAEDKIGIIGSQINQAQALQNLGFYRRSQKLFTEIENQLETEADSLLKVKSWHNLGNIRRQGRDLESSQEILERSLTLLETLVTTQPSLLNESVLNKSQILLSLANTERALAQREEGRKNQQLANSFNQAALTHYQQAAANTDFPLIQIQSKLNQLSLELDNNLNQSTQSLLSEINSLLPQLPVSRPSIYASINLAQSLMKLEQKQEIKIAKIAPILINTVDQAQKIQDSQAESYALGTLGEFYEQKADWLQAKKFTLSALLIAQTINTPELAYRWQWQMGRIIQNRTPQIPNNQDTNTEALNYYTQAFNTLNQLRSDLVILNPEVQFSFRESVEPVYRQLVDLLLRSPQPSKRNLIQARNVIEALQLAEIDNFFRDACAKPKKVDIDNLDASAAVIYPIILENRLEIILKLPGVNNLRHYVYRDVPGIQVEQAVQALRRSLTRRSTSLNQVKQESQQIYNWLVKPLETDLENKIKTLVFVLDGSLRNLPMAALYDGKRYLIEKYAVAVTPGLQLLEPQSLLPEQLNVLLAGATDAPSFRAEGLSPLDNVEVELAEVAQQITNHQKLTEREFLQQNLKNLINSVPFNVVHIATHGTFSSNPEQTYLLDWQKRIRVKDFDNLLRVREEQIATPIELLILSACETAAGDKRAALGLAGISIRAGTRSTLATLWQINDASTTEFMIQFYQQLKNPLITKAEALRQAQLAFLTKYSDTDYDRPYHWASFILVGNWL